MRTLGHEDPIEGVLRFKIEQLSKLEVQSTVELKRSFDREFANLGYPSIERVPGVYKLILKLQKKGILIAVLSNRSHEDAVRLTRSKFPGIQFDAIVGERQSVASKPHRDAMLNLCNFLGVSMRSTVMVGDTVTDMETAKRCDTLGIGVTWGACSAPVLTRHGASFLARSAVDVSNILKVPRDLEWAFFKGP